MTPHIYNGLIRTYAGATKIPHIEEHQIESYVKDAWALLDQMKEKDIPLNVQILDSMVLLHSRALFIDELHDKVLPLFERHRIQPSIFTYQNLMEGYQQIGETELVLDTYDRIIQLKMEPNASILKTYLTEVVNINEPDRIIECLETYEKKDIIPPGKIINKLSKMSNPSDRLFVALKSLPLQYGVYRENMRRFPAAVKSLRPGLKGKNMKTRNSRRTKRTRKKGF